MHFFYDIRIYFNFSHFWSGCIDILLTNPMLVETIVKVSALDHHEISLWVKIWWKQSWSEWTVGKNTTLSCFSRMELGLFYKQVGISSGSIRAYNCFAGPLYTTLFHWVTFTFQTSFSTGTASLCNQRNKHKVLCNFFSLKW